MPRLTTDWRTWLRGLISAFIQGGSSAVLGSLGLASGEAMGLEVHALDYKQMGGVFLGAAVIRLLFYLNQHAVPDRVPDYEQARAAELEKPLP